MLARPGRAVAGEHSPKRPRGQESGTQTRRFRDIGTAKTSPKFWPLLLKRPLVFDAWYKNHDEEYLDTKCSRRCLPREFSGGVSNVDKNPGLERFRRLFLWTEGASSPVPLRG